MPPSVKNLALFHKRDNSDCLVCIIKPVVDVGAYFGICPILVQCRHTSKSIAARVSRSLHRRCVQLLWIVLLLSGMAVNGYMRFLEKPDILSSLNLVAEIFYCLCTVTIMICTFISPDLRMKEINACISLIEHRLSYGIVSLFSPEYIQRARRKAYCFYVFVIALVFLLAVYINCTISEIQSVEFHVIKHSTAIVSTIVPIVGIYQYSVQSALFKQMYMICFKYIENTLIARHNVVELRRYYDPKVPIFGDLEAHLKRMIKFQKALYWNLTRVWMNFDPMVLIWFVLILAILILNTYLILVTSFSGNVYNDFFIMLEIRTFFVLGSTVYFLIAVGRLSSLVSRPTTTNLDQNHDKK